ncbi:hypothetical protein HYV31_02975 [candidate division WWE3 bacterium]|nr:hypothetical protein [candidate division WWE3 bacterium]
MQSYETPFTLEQNKPVVFPDFTIEYLGEREVEIPKFVHKHFIYRDYKITFEGKEQNLSWTSGTGLLAPLKFDVLDKHFTFQPWGIDNKSKEISIVKL